MQYAREVAVILVNTANSNICIRQPLLVAEMYEKELEPGHYNTNMDQEGNHEKG